MPARVLTQADISTVPLLLSLNGAPTTSIDDEDSEGSLGQVLGKMYRTMPAELKHMILNQVDGLARALMDCAKHIRASYALLSTFKAKSAEARTRPLSDTVPTSLGANMVTILDEECLLDFGYGDGVWEHKIPITNSQFSGVEVSYGTYGVTAMRLMYKDGTSSPWLGGRSRKFVKFSRGSDFSRLSTVFDVSASPA
jgi:hypothetical protein